MHPLTAEEFAAAKVRRDATTAVYFIESGGLVKIGFARSPLARFAALLTHCPLPASLLATCPGGPTLEKELHKRFAASRAHGEWFRRSPEMDAVIAAAETQYGPEYHNRVVALAGRLKPDPPRRPKPKVRRRSRYEWSPEPPLSTTRTES